MYNLLVQQWTLHFSEFSVHFLVFKIKNTKIKLLLVIIITVICLKYLYDFFLQSNFQYLI